MSARAGDAHEHDPAPDLRMTRAPNAPVSRILNLLALAKSSIAVA
jgi:hypothetical protein